MKANQPPTDRSPVNPMIKGIVGADRNLSQWLSSTSARTADNLNDA